jgi:cytochrome c
MTTLLRCLLLAVPLALAWTVSPAQAPTPLQVKAGCAACHFADRKLVGPAYKEIATKYRGRADAVPYLMQRVRKGGPGNWGQVPMVPTDVKQLSDADLKTILGQILKTP